MQYFSFLILKFQFLLITCCFIYNGTVCAQINDKELLSTIALEGKWGFALDQNDEGIHKKWFTGNLTDKYLGNILYKSTGNTENKFVANFTDEISLPGTTDLAGWGTPDQSPWINYLQRKHKYIGAAWYQKIIDIPANWRGYSAELFLERVKWQSRVWIDGVELTKPDDGLVTSHKHNLGVLSPGKHLIAIRIDNRMIHPIGDKGHNYTEQTESIWNGIVGKIELRRKAIVGLNRVRLFSNLKNKTVSLDLNVGNPQKLSEVVKIDVKIYDNHQKLIKNIAVYKKLSETEVVNYRIDIPLQSISAWSEFQQPLYTAICTISTQNQKEISNPVTFAFRDLSTSRYKILVNGQPTFIRGNQEALGYPLTGYPPMDVATWKKIFGIYKAHGLNQVRFHSSCPPDAAFQAADELGIYVMVELVWMTSTNAKADLRPISATMGIPQGIGNNDRTLDSFILSETRRLLDQYGNHPSFCFFAFGNEMDNINKQLVNKWISDFKKDDPRHLYAATTARAVLPDDDFQDSHMVAGKGSIVNKSGNPSTISNYDSAYVYTKVPVIAHELGQFPVYPSWSELPKYNKTPFRFVNLEKSLELAKANHIDQQDEIFRKTSGHLQQLLYKEEIERQFSSRYSAGFNLLQMNDYSGQGEALVGWLDAFYDTKGIVTPEAFRDFCNTGVVLARFPKRVYKTTEDLDVAFQMAYSGQKAMKTGLHWELVDHDNQIVRSGKLGSNLLKAGEVVDFGSAHIIFPKVESSRKYTLRAFTPNMEFKNEWDFWAFNTDFQSSKTKGSEVSICNTIEDVLKSAKEGKRVLFLADQAGDPFQKYFSSFVPVFWSTLFFPGAGPQTLGAVVDHKHPALNGFPTEDALDWQWQQLCNQSRGTILDGEAIDLKPIVQPIDDFHANRKLASLFEVKYGTGSILICGYNLSHDLENRPEAVQLKQSLLNYVSSDVFKPTVEISESWLRNKYATASTSSGQNSATGTDIKLSLPSNVTFNQLSNLKFELKTATTTIGFIYLKVSADNAEDTKFTMTIDERKNTYPVKNEPSWIKVQYFREDFDDQKLQMTLLPDAKTANLKIIEVRMEPDN